MGEHRPAAGDPVAPAGGGVQSRLGFLDALRAIAAIAVVAQHAFEHSSVAALRRLTDFSPGVFGVVLFFLVSGFAIPVSVRGALDPRSFAIRRLCRIYPAVLAAFALWFLLSTAGLIGDGEARRASAADWAANLLLIHDYVRAPSFLGVTWTLSLEFGWYLLFAAGLIVLRRRAAVVMEVTAPAALLLLCLASLALDHRLPLGRFGMIYAAVVGYQAYRYYVGQIGLRHFALDAAAFLAIMAIANGIAFGHFRHPNMTLSQSLWPWIVAPLIFFAAVTIPRLRSAIGDGRILPWLGVTSFSIYLLHPLAIGIVVRHGPGAGAAAQAAIFALTILLAAIGYYAVERPGIELGRRWARRAPPRPALAANAG